MLLLFTGLRAGFLSLRVSLLLSMWLSPASPGTHAPSTPPCMPGASGQGTGLLRARGQLWPSSPSAKAPDVPAGLPSYPVSLLPPLPTQMGLWPQDSGGQRSQGTTHEESGKGRLGAGGRWAANGGLPVGLCTQHAGLGGGQIWAEFSGLVFVWFLLTQFLHGAAARIS